MTTDIAGLLTFANLQMAAESWFGIQPGSPVGVVTGTCPSISSRFPRSKRRAEVFDISDRQFGCESQPGSRNHARSCK